MKTNRFTIVQFLSDKLPILLILISMLSIIPFLSTPAFAQDGENGENDLSQWENWQPIAQKEGFTEQDISRLKAQKILMTNKAWKQVFDPYIQGELPLFITSDSLLNAYHVLYEESVMKLETANSTKLRKILKIVWNNLQSQDINIKGNPALHREAKQRALIIIGTALKLLNENDFKCDKETEKLIDEETARVEKAEGLLKPQWLGKPDPGFMALDYSRYKPRGFYTRSESLKRYFRAVSWLQSIPFRMNNDAEFLSILMLGNTLSENRMDSGEKTMVKKFFNCYRQFVGQKDDLDVYTISENATDITDANPDAGYLKNARKALVVKLGIKGSESEINDTFRFTPDNPDSPAEISFRIISAYRLPDAVMFFRTTDQKVFRRDFPTGMEVCAVLGSNFAAGLISPEDKEKLLKKIDECKPLFKGESLYLDYLNCLKALLEPPPADSPGFMKGEAWKIKSLQTVLAGWAQMRHTWALQAKQTAMYAGGAELPPGFVEPVPVFYAKMRGLTGKTGKLLKEAGAFSSREDIYAADIRETLELLRRLNLAKSAEVNEEDLSEADRNLYFFAQELGMLLKVEADYKNSGKYWSEAIQKMEKLVSQLEKGKKPEDQEILYRLEMRNQDVEFLWKELEDISEKLETLSRKQLRGEPQSEGDVEFIRDYGVRIARVMLYGGNSYLTPRDDAPRIVDVFNNHRKGKYLEVGISRSRALFVLYPYKGKEIFCQGAVMPYYEFTVTQRMNDKEWKTMLDGKDRPTLPSWILPIVSSGGIGDPGIKGDEGF